MKEIKECTRTVKSNLVEQTAYLHASAAKKNLDLDKFKRQVQKEMDKKSANSDQGNEFFIETCPLHSIVTKKTSNALQQSSLYRLKIITFLYLWTSDNCEPFFRKKK